MDWTTLRTLISAMGLTAVTVWTSSVAIAGSVGQLNTFTPNTPAKAEDVNQNFTDIRAAVNDNAAAIAAETNASTICDGTNVYLDGDGNCDTLGAGTVSYMLAQIAGFSQSTDIGSGNHVKFDQIDASFGTNITLDTTSPYSNADATPSIGRFTLTGGKTYRLWGHISVLAATNFIGFSWYDVDAGMVLGVEGGSFANASQDGNADSAPAVAYITPINDTLVELRHTGGLVSASGYYAGNPNLSGTRAIIEEIAAGADLAELYPTKDRTLRPGELISMDLDHPVFVKRTIVGENPIGIYSTDPGKVLSDHSFPGEHLVPVALTGRIPVKVVLENGPIKSGDYLTTSSTPGYAMKATKSGRVIGMALESAHSEHGRKDREILVFLNPHYWVNPEDYLKLRAEVDFVKSQLKILKAQSESMDFVNLTMGKD